MSIKPHFVLAGALPVLYALARTRSLRALAGPENWAAGLVLVLYAGLIWFRYPVFLETWIPILQDTYRAVRKPVFHLLTDPASLGLVAALGGAALAMGRTALAPRPAVSGLAAFGFLAAALEQAKLWNNHLYPALAFLLLIALADFRPALHRGGTGAERLAGGLGLALVVAGCVAGLSAMAFRPATTVAFAPTIRALGPDRPRLFALSGSIAAGNPLAAQVNAEWTGAPFGQWLFQFSDHRLTTEKLDPATRQRLQRFAERDRDYARAAIVNGRPDFILVDRATYDWRNWALGDPALSGALGDYTPVEQSSGVELWARRELAAGRTGPAGH